MNTIKCADCGCVFSKHDPRVPIPVGDDMLCEDCRTCEHGFDVRRCYICQTEGIANEAQ